MLQADKLHWTVQSALHDMTLEAMVEPMARAISRLKENGSIKSYLDVNDTALAKIIIKGSEAIIYSESEEGIRGCDLEKIRDVLTAFWRRMIEF